jgi:hypothetical protein
MRPNNVAGGLGKPPLYSFRFIRIFRHNELRCLVEGSFMISLLKQRVSSQFSIRNINRREGRISIKHEQPKGRVSWV